MLGNVTQNTDVQKAVAVIKEYNADERVREIARRRRETKFNERDALNAEYTAGKAEGRAETKAEDRENFIKGLRKSGISEDQIPIILKNSGIE